MPSTMSPSPHPFSPLDISPQATLLPDHPTKLPFHFRYRTKFHLFLGSVPFKDLPIFVAPSPAPFLFPIRSTVYMYHPLPISTSPSSRPKPFCLSAQYHASSTTYRDFAERADCKGMTMLVRETNNPSGAGSSFS